MYASRWLWLAGLFLVAGGVLFARQSGPSLAGLDSTTPYSLKQVLDGSIVPLTLKREGLPPDYRLVYLSDEVASLNLASMFSPGHYYYSAQSLGESGEPQNQIMSTFGFYTSGQTVVVDGSKFYVAYRKNLSNSDLRLNLLRVDAVRSIVPLEENLKQTDVPLDNRAEALARIKQAGLATLLYCSDYDDLFPNGQGTSEVVGKLMPYAKNNKVFQSPETGGQFHFNIHLAGQSTSRIDRPAEMPVWKEDLPSLASPFAVDFADGHARTLQPSEHAEIEKLWRSRKPF